MEEDQRILDSRYIIEQRLGSGGEGIAYLVRDLNSPDPNLRLTAKILEFKGSEDEVEYKDDDDIQETINHTIQVFERIRTMNPQNPNIIRCIAQSKGGIVRNDILLRNRNYFIFEYAPKGDLWKMTQLAGGFSERCAKPIFKKILLGVQALHNSGVYHLDLKVDNIVLDNHFNPKITDFGLASLENGILTNSVGTKNCKPPQMFESPIRYTGEKADIFSLGCVLFALVAKDPWFYEATSTDKYYRYIYTNTIEDRQTYFDKLSVKNNVINLLSQEFKDLYIKMISKNEEDRPSIENILNDVWFNEISNLNPQQQMALDNEVQTQFLQKEQECNDIFEINPNLLEQFETFPTDNRYMNFIKRKPLLKLIISLLSIKKLYLSKIIII